MAALSPRARRAIKLMLLSAVVIAVAAGYYARPWATSPKPAAAEAPVRPFPVQKAGYIVSYSFASLALGWAAEAPQPHIGQSGNFAIFKTVDAGRHWRKQLEGHTPVTFTTLFSFKFVDAYHGFLVAGDPLLLNRTSDGGEHWTRLALPTAEGVAFQFTDVSHLWVLAGRQIDPPRPFHIFASSDGGDTWTQRADMPADPYVYPLFRDGAEGWSGATSQAAPYVWFTSDGGRTWERRELPWDLDLHEPVATSIRLLPQVGVLAYTWMPAKGGQPTAIFTSVDGGRSWWAVNFANPGGNLALVTFQDQEHWWSIQDRALYKTGDGGRTWMVVRVQASGSLTLLWIFDARHAWAQLDEGFGTELAFTSDGGLHWTRTNAPIQQ